MKKIIIISGPTAVGKSDIAIKLAKLIDGEIISADSIQVYKGLDIGSAKLTSSDMQGIKHYLIDVLNPDETFDVSVFKDMAKKAIDEISGKGKIPIIVGGTAFYIQALLYDIDFSEEDEDHSYREELAHLDEDTLFDMLLLVDSKYAESVHKNNKKRVIRALEYFHHTGKQFSSYNEQQSMKPAVYDFRYFVLNDNRQKLYQRIDKRVDDMIEAGLVSEVASLLDKGYDKELNSMQGIGYKEIAAYLLGESTLEQAILDIKKNSRHFAKRQLTWFRHEQSVEFIDVDKFDYDFDKIAKFLATY